MCQCNTSQLPWYQSGVNLQDTHTHKVHQMYSVERKL